MDLIVRLRDREERVAVERFDGGWLVRVGEAEYQVDAASLGGAGQAGSPVKSLVVDGCQYEVAVYPENRHRYAVSTSRGNESVEIMDPLAFLAAEAQGSGRSGTQQVTAYMPGRVVKVLVELGQEVEAGQGLVVLEAMKMENEIKAESPGIVQKIAVSDGQAVDGGDLLFEIESSPE